MVYPYDPRELIAFAGIGVVCGMGGALYVYVHRRYVLWMRGNKKLTEFLQKNRFIYPFLISFLITSLTFPDLLGQFTASKLNTHDQVSTYFGPFFDFDPYLHTTRKSILTKPTFSRVFNPNFS